MVRKKRKLRRKDHELKKTTKTIRDIVAVKTSLLILR